jgi:hypothetical protein
MKRPTGMLLTLVLVVAADQGAFAADLISVYREATLQDAACASAKAAVGKLAGADLSDINALLKDDTR